jgi:hypothetical protein
MWRKITGVMALALCLIADEAAAADIALTSVGQSPDAVMVRVLLKKLKLESDYNAAMTADGLKDAKVLVAVVGGSSKGLGAAGIDKAQELKRGLDLVNAAKSKGVKVAVMHVGGDGRRGELSDIFIEGIVPLAESLIVVKGGNEDGIFSRLKPSSVELSEPVSIQASGGALEAVLRGWGVAP